VHPPNVAKEICFLFVRLPWQIQMVVIFLNLREWKETKEQGKECFVVSFGEFHLKSLAFFVFVDENCFVSSSESERGFEP
jgi:hypothetical protein